MDTEQHRGDHNGQHTAVDAALIVGNAGNTIGYTELQAIPPKIDMALTVSDADSLTLASAAVGITNGFLAGDTLNFSDQNGISGSYNAATGMLTLTGTATVLQYQAALESVTFSSSSHNPTNFGTDTSRSISWVVNNGTGNSAPASSTINITPVNDAPVVNAHGGSLAYTEDQAATAIDTALTVSDVDSVTWPVRRCQSQATSLRPRTCSGSPIRTALPAATTAQPVS